MESLFSASVLGFGIATATLAFTVGAVTAWHLSARYTRRLCQRDAETAACYERLDWFNAGVQAGHREADRDHRSGYVDGLRDARAVRAWPTLTIVGRQN